MYQKPVENLLNIQPYWERGVTDLGVLDADSDISYASSSHPLTLLPSYPHTLPPPLLLSSILLPSYLAPPLLPPLSLPQQKGTSPNKNHSSYSFETPSPARPLTPFYRPFAVDPNAGTTEADTVVVGV